MSVFENDGFRVFASISAIIVGASLGAAWGASSRVDNESAEIQKHLELREAWASAITGYLETHELDVSSLSEGVQIGWVKHSENRETWGIAEFSGNTSPNDCPMFTIIKMTGGATTDSQLFVDEEICLE